MDLLNIIQITETNIEPGEDLFKHKYSFEEVDAIVKQAQRLEEIKTLNGVIANLIKKSLN